MIEIIVIVVLFTVIQWRLRAASYRVFLKHESYKKTDGLNYPCVVVYVGRRGRGNPLICKRLFSNDIGDDDEKLLDAISEAKTTAIRLNSAIGKKPRQLMR